MAAQLQESRDMLLDGTHEQESAKPASPGRVRQTRGDPGRERRPEDLSGRLITAAHASVDSWGGSRTRLDCVLGQDQEHGCKHRVQDAMTLKRRKATEGMEKVVMANAGSTAMSQCSTDGMTPCAR